MPSIFITSASNPFGYALSTTQTVTDQVALAAEAGSWGILSARRLSNTPSPSDVERTESVGGPGGGITALSQATDYNASLVAPMATETAARIAADTALSTGKAPALTLIPSGNHTLLITDNGGVAENETAATITVNIGLGATFGCGFQGIGVLTFNGSASVVDRRTHGAAYPAAALFPTTTVDVYNLIGSQA